MADLIVPKKRQSLSEIRTWDIDFTPDMKTGVTVSSATATHVPPSGSASTPVVGIISANVVPVKLGPLTVVGIHTLKVLATLSDAQKSEAWVKVEVEF